MTHGTDGLLSTGGLAARLGISTSRVKQLEAAGVILRGQTVEGSGRRVWRADQLPIIQAQFQERRRKVRSAA